MSETPIGDAVAQELFPPAGTTMDQFLEMTDDGSDDEEPTGAAPEGHNDDTDDDLSDVEEGEDTDDDLDDTDGVDDADPAAPHGTP